MNDRAATLDAAHDGTGGVELTVASPAARAGSMKFTYPSGARPLEGYTIKRGVGIGGFGEVYFAVTDAGKEVALKRVQRNLEIELRGVSQCLNLKHQNLVDLYDIRYDDQGGAWVVMEYITGESLKDVLDRHPNGLMAEDVVRWFLGIAQGVAYLHDQGIVHRDLKPGNIFEDQGCVKIGDYGLSKFISCSRRSGQTESVGTFHYMAPEIGKGSYGKEIDIYALGIILYEMLTGRVPFDGESSQEIIMRHLTEDADVSQIPGPYRTAVSRALTKDPELRYSHVGQMLDDLAGVLNVGRLPVVTATVVTSKNAQDDVLYIGDDPPPQEMQFGPVKTRKPSRLEQIVNSPARKLREARGTVARPANAPTREPIGQAVTGGAQKVASWWQGSSLSTGLKVAIIVALLATAIFNADWVLPLGIGAAVVYAIYAGIWLLAQSVKTPTPPPSPGIRFRSWQELIRENLKGKQLGERLGELSGSWLAAAIISGLLSVVMIAAGDAFNTNIDTLSLYTWLAISATFGSWAVLAVGKFCEGVESDAMRRRMVMLALGLAVGAAAFGLQQALLVDLSAAQAAIDPPASMVGSQGDPKLPLFLVYFGALFAVPGWWKQTDPLRKTRVNLMSLVGCVLWGGVISLFWPFPQPWGLMLAATVSLSAQLASQWMTTQDREAAKREFRRA